jgi:hypothetical protein
MIIGYEIYGRANASQMTGSCEKLFPDIKVPQCPVCSYRTDYRVTNPKFILKRKNYDFSFTYDGIIIVSIRFKDFCLSQGYKNFVFVPLPKYPRFFQFYVEGNTIEYKAHQKENFCEYCLQYESVIGAAMNLEKVDNALADGFYQSDLWFATGNEKSPIIVVAPK